LSILERKLKLAVNPDLIDKNEAGNMSLFASGWVNVELTPDEFADAIRSGRAYCTQLNGSQGRQLQGLQRRLGRR
jgi:hypothetical protein